MTPVDEIDGHVQLDAVVNTGLLTFPLRSGSPRLCCCNGLPTNKCCVGSFHFWGKLLLPRTGVHRLMNTVQAWQEILQTGLICRARADDSVNGSLHFSPPPPPSPPLPNPSPMLGSRGEAKRATCLGLIYVPTRHTEEDAACCGKQARMTYTPHEVVRHIRSTHRQS